MFIGAAMQARLWILSCLITSLDFQIILRRARKKNKIDRTSHSSRQVIRHAHNIMYFVSLVAWECREMGQSQFALGLDTMYKTANPILSIMQRPSWSSVSEALVKLGTKLTCSWYLVLTTSSGFVNITAVTELNSPAETIRSCSRIQLSLLGKSSSKSSEYK